MRGVIVAAVATLAGCTNFDYITADQCGNGVVEEGEDCDLVAGAPGADSCVGCRYHCGEFFFACPAGWGCGVIDGVCRYAVGRYEESSPALDVDVTDFVIEDLDGDPFPDAIGYGPTEIWVARGTPGPGFALADRYPRVRGDVLPALGDSRLDDEAVSFSGAPRPDVAISPGLRAVAMFATDDGVLTPAPQTWFRLWALAQMTTPVRTPSSAPFHDLASYDMLLGRMWIDRPGAVDPATLLLPVPAPCTADVLQLVAADLDGDDVDELLLGCGGSTTVELVDVTLNGANEPALSSLATLTLTSPLIGPLMVGDLDGDTRLDVLGAVATGEFAIDFSVIHQTAPMTFAAGIADTRLGGAKLLAAGDLDGDGELDLVSSAGIEVASGAGFVHAATSPTTWTHAAIADVNADGVRDVVGIADGEIDVLLGAASGTYAPRVALTTGIARALSTGDLDGDGLADVAALFRDGTFDRVLIQYGARDGGFDLVDAGELPQTVRGFAVADVSQVDTLLAPDAISEIIVATGLDVSVFVGGSARPPVAPLDPTIDPRLLALGRFAPLSEGVTHLDLFVVGDQTEPSTAWYGGFSSHRELEDRHVMADAQTGCVPQFPVTAIGNIAGFGGDSLIELGCGQSLPGVQARARRLTGEPELPALAAPDAWWIGSTEPPICAVVADLDDDVGEELIAVTDTTFEPVRILHNTGGGLDMARVVTAGDDYVVGLAIGNIDDDPQVEVVTSQFSSLHAYDYTKDGTTPVIAASTGGEWSIAASGVPRLHDLDRDGVLDVVVGGDRLRVFRAIPHDER